MRLFLLCVNQSVLGKMFAVFVQRFALDIETMLAQIKYTRPKPEASELMQSLNWRYRLAGLQVQKNLPRLAIRCNHHIPR